MTSGITKALRNIVAERDGYTCIFCTNGYTDVHHVIPRSRGGRNVPHNLISVCRMCHMRLHNEVRISSLDKDEMELRMVQYISDYYADDEDFWLDVGKFNKLVRDEELSRKMVKGE